MAGAMPKKVLPGLPDYIAPGLRVLFVGINPGLRSAQVGHHFAGYSNRFWKLLADSKLIPVPLTYREDGRLLEWGIGLTNVVPRPTKGIDELTIQDYHEGRMHLINVIKDIRPQVVALLGLGIARLLLSDSSGTEGVVRKKSDKLTLGLQSVLLHHTPVFVLPNPSGRNAHYSYQDMSHWFRTLGHLVDSRSNR